MTNDTKTLTAADAVREAIRRLAENDTTFGVTAKDVQPVAEQLSPAVKDGYASFYLAAFAREGSVKRLHRGAYDTTFMAEALGAVPSAQAETGLTQAELEEMTKGELVQLAKDQGIELKNVKNTKKDGIVEQLMAR